MGFAFRDSIRPEPTKKSKCLSWSHDHRGHKSREESSPRQLGWSQCFIRGALLDFLANSKSHETYSKDGCHPYQGGTHTFVQGKDSLLLYSLSNTVPCSFVDWILCRLCLKPDLDSVEGVSD